MTAPAQPQPDGHHATPPAAAAKCPPRRRASNRIKLSKELMLRLSQALGARCAGPSPGRAEQQGAGPSSQSQVRPSSARAASLETASQHELAEGSHLAEPSEPPSQAAANRVQMELGWISLMGRLARSARSKETSCRRQSEASRPEVEVNAANDWRRAERSYEMISRVAGRHSAPIASDCVTRQVFTPAPKLLLTCAVRPRWRLASDIRHAGRRRHQHHDKPSSEKPASSKIRCRQDRAGHAPGRPVATCCGDGCGGRPTRLSSEARSEQAPGWWPASRSPATGLSQVSASSRLDQGERGAESAGCRAQRNQAEAELEAGRRARLRVGRTRESGNNKVNKADNKKADNKNNNTNEKSKKGLSSGRLTAQGAGPTGQPPAAPSSSKLSVIRNCNEPARGRTHLFTPAPGSETLIRRPDTSREEEGGQARAVTSPQCDSRVEFETRGGSAGRRKAPAGRVRALRHAHLLLLAISLAAGWLLSVRGPALPAAAAPGRANDTASTGDELSRAVLATMSTQSSYLPELNQSEPPEQAEPATGEGQLLPASSPLDRLLELGRIFLMGAIMVGDICGNSLVILSVCRHSKLRVTTNWFVVSLACADILVALFAMTFNASVIIWGRWLFKPWVCNFWNSCDVLASTASILHLCCISIDRYIAIMRPLDYPMKITTRRVMYALCAVWISSALLSYIPIFTGIYTTAEHIKWLEENPDQCEFVVNRVYAIVSSSISFWIPCCIMVFTYYRIYREATRQEKFIYKAQSMMPAPMANHQEHNHAAARSKQRRSKSLAVGGPAGSGLKGLQAAAKVSTATTRLGSAEAPAEAQPLTGSDPNNNNNNNSGGPALALAVPSPGGPGRAPGPAHAHTAAGEEPADEQDERDSNSGQSTPTKRSISKMKREHKAAKTLGIIMGVFILCWLPFFSWYTPQHICGHACDGMVPPWAVTLLFWIGYFNSTLNPIIYAYFNHEFRDAFKKTLQWIFCCCQDLKCLRVSRPNDNQHYNCTYRSTQEIGLVSNS